MNSKFTVGTEVFFFNKFTKDFTIHKIHKVYKTGNFILEPGGQQYDPGNNSDYAYSTAGHHNYCEVLTFERRIELKEEKDAHNRTHDFGHVIDKLYRLSRNTPVSVEQLERFRVLAKEFGIS